MKTLLLLFIALLAPLTAETTPLGLPTTLSDLYIPGPKAETIPRKDSTASLVIRILEIKPASDGFRYHLEVYGLDPGTHRLAHYLRYTNGAPITDLDTTIEITTRHPLDTLPKPETLKPKDPDHLGGYRLLITILGILWLLILLLIIFYKKKQPPAPAPPAPEPTLHQKLSHLVTSASQGDLTDTQRAHLERLITGHWKEKIPAIAILPPAKALTQLRTHPQASPLILKLEQWLHAPNPDLSQKEITPLLEPYRANPKS